MGNDMDSLRLKINIPFCGGVPLKKRKFIVSEFRAKNPSPLTFNLFFFFTSMFITLENIMLFDVVKG
jgi:hypothetical protein